MAGLRLGERAIHFSLRGVDGESHSLADYGDRLAVGVIFLCNYCPYVMAWEDRLIRLQADYARVGIQFIAINPNDAEQYPEDSFDNMVRRARDKGYNFPYLQDATQEIARAYGATRTPEVFLFDQQRTLVYHGTVDDNHQDADAVRVRYLRLALEAILGGYRPPFEETPLVGCAIQWKNGNG